MDDTDAVAGASYEPPTPSSEIDWERLLAHLPVIAAPEFVAGVWVDMEHRDDGSWSMPYVELSAAALAFVASASAAMFPFDYRQWWFDGGRRLVEEPHAVDEATLDDIRRLLTLHIRNDRFMEGHLLHAFESGHMVRVLQRIAALTRDT